MLDLYVLLLNIIEEVPFSVGCSMVPKKMRRKQLLYVFLPRFKCQINMLGLETDPGWRKKKWKEGEKKKKANEVEVRSAA